MNNPRFATHFARRFCSPLTPSLTPSLTSSQYNSAKETRDKAFASLRELLKFPEPTVVHVPVPEDIGDKREVKFNHERLGSKVVKVPEGVTGTWATSLYPTCDYTIAEKKALHDYSAVYDDFVNVEAEVSWRRARGAKR